MYRKYKRQIYLLLDPADGGTTADKAINSFIVGLILLNTIAVILETVQSIYTPYRQVFYIIELFSVGFFSIEYLLRIWCCTCIEKYKHPVKGRLKYMLSPGAIIDLLAILPFYLPLMGPGDLRFVRSLRLLRFFRFFKLGRYLNASRVISNVFKSKKEELVLSFVITLFLIVIASCVMYYAEHDAQPEKFSSIPETMWWSVATLTTVGYGDEYPITGLGKFLTACISILGIGMFALPAGILASGFSDEFKKLRKEKNCCPHCGKEI
ncbi:ion transporter [Ferruginibacter sp. HRS2-29]|uniref:ion transporter n=1 Tax=Ferruginibacter sp. HRS2-29 TaxID=2487334 RepID=UPI0020CE135A|nr:ion transporter [Ferruginibacter sp. HRS2-29]MCP9752347.1 ion transporter [Ferruginibacter sp. HRS2-29]